MAHFVVLKDKNLKPENIKQGVKIFKVEGTYEGGATPVLQVKTVDPSGNVQIITPDASYDGLSQVTVNGAPLQNRTVNASTAALDITKASNDYYGLRHVYIKAVDASIDSNIVADNIKKDVSILGVVGTYEGSGGSDWLADALAGNITDLSGYALPAPNRDKQYYYLFWKYPVEGMPDFSGWTSVSGDSAMEFTFYDSSLYGDVDMSSLTSVSGSNALYQTFYNCSGITSVDLSNLAAVSDYGCSYTFSNCTGLTEAHVDSLPSSFNNNRFTGMFSNCSNLETVYCTVESLYNSGSGNVIYNLSSIENLYLTTSPEGYNVYINWQPNLTADSVLNILQHITHRNTFRTYSVNFYSEGLTVQDDAQGSIQAAYDAAVALNWRIANLTITPYSGS